MKRTLFVLTAAVVMLFSLTACRGTNESENPKQPVNDSSYVADGYGSVMEQEDDPADTTNTGKTGKTTTKTTTKTTDNGSGNKTRTKTSTTTRSAANRSSRSGSFTGDMENMMDDAGRTMGDIADGAMDAVDNAMNAADDAMDSRSAGNRRNGSGTMEVPNYRSPA